MDLDLSYFPYEKLRPYQDLFLKSIAEAISSHRHICLEGVSGLGKTIAALSALIPIVKKNGLLLCYLTRTHRQIDRVIQELIQISKKAPITGIGIYGRRHMCLHPFILSKTYPIGELTEVCSILRRMRLCDFYENLQRKANELIKLENLANLPLSASKIIKLSRNHELCPYEVAKLLATSVDILVLPYNYIFDKAIRERFLGSIKKSLSDIILVIDECHNLPQVISGIASKSLSISTICKAQNEAREFGYTKVYDFCKLLKETILNLSINTETENYVEPNLFLNTLCERTGYKELFPFAKSLSRIGREIRERKILKGCPSQSFIERIGKFILFWIETVKGPYVHILSRSPLKETFLKLEIIALDPRPFAKEVFESVYAHVSFSGTIELRSYVKILGLSPNDTICKVIPSPIPKENLLVLCMRKVSTAKKKRSEIMYKRLVNRCIEAIDYTPGNVGVFTASYEVLKGLLKAGLADKVKKKLFIENEFMSSEENAKLIRDFKQEAKEGGAVLLATCGGRASEGVDYPGKEMLTAIIVGVPYSEPSPKVSALISYTENEFPGEGFKLSYVIPAIQKAAHAAGRPIRSLSDKGAIIFLDYRFSTRYCKRFLPYWIRKNMKKILDERGAIAKELILFFGLD